MQLLTEQVLGLHGVRRLFTPRHFAIRASLWHSIVPNPYNLVKGIDNACPHLGSGVLAPLGSKESNRHEIALPTQILGPLVAQHTAPNQGGALDFGALRRGLLRATVLGN